MKIANRIALVALIVVVLTFAAPAQQLPQSGQPAAAPAARTALPADLAATLSQIDQAAQATAGELQNLKINKWKADSSSKQQAEQNAQSLSRNMTAALPGMLQQVRANPSSVAAQFKLYRNLNALYDVFSSMTEAAGAFGSKQDYQALSNQLNTFDQARLALANRLESVTAQQDAEIARLRTTVQQAATPPAPTKKIVVDDSAPANKTSKSTKKKKSTAKPAAPTPQT